MRLFEPFLASMLSGSRGSTSADGIAIRQSILYHKPGA